MTNLKKNIKGFTLIEVIIVTLIATLIIGTLTGALVTMTKSYELNQNIVDLQYQAQVTLNTLVEEIKYSKGIQKVYGSPNEIDLSSDIKVEEVSMFCIKEKEDSYTYFKIEGNNLYYKENLMEEDLLYNDELLSMNKEDLLATHIERIELTSFNGDILNTDSVNIGMTFNKNDAQITVSNQANIKNK